MQKPARYLVIGNPIAHSLSPQLHTLFAEQTQQHLVYDRLCVEPENFVKALDDFFASGGKGANITAPFKTQAYEYTKKYCSDAAVLSGSVNTLYVHPEKKYICGANTDGIGLVRDLQKAHWPIFNQHILILGAGGATRGILPALLAENPASMSLYNRSQDKAKKMMDQFSLSLPTKSHYDLIINTIPAYQIPRLPQVTATYLYDLNYIHGPVIQTIETSHIRHGLGMLLEQAVESFYIWRGVRPELTQTVLDNLNHSFEN